MSRRFFSIALGFGPLLVLSSACVDRALSSSACSNVTVRVTAGIQPSFSWTPACRIEGLTVHLPGTGAVIWGTVSHNQANNIESPVVRYGVFPDSAAQTANILLPLVAGTTYQVALFRVDDGSGGSLQRVGVTTFVP